MDYTPNLEGGQFTTVVAPVRDTRSLARTTTVTTQGAYLVDQVTEVGTFVGHMWGLSHGHGQAQTLESKLTSCTDSPANASAHPKVDPNVAPQ